MAAFQLASPAKLNLALEIVGRRPDGFHELRTVFERIDLADTLSFAPSGDGRIHLACDHPAVPCGPRNLVYRAAQLLREGEGVTAGARIRITKRIPVAAGLAGGSSNAATALTGLNRLWRLGLSRKELIRYGRELGSDVPFFLHDCSFAIGTGRGDRIKPVRTRARFWHVLITPQAPLLTKEVYALYAARFSGRRSPAGIRAEVRLTKPGADVTMLVCSLKKSDIIGVQKTLFNDLAGPIGVLRPALVTLKERLQKRYPQGVCFSGSGPSVFVLTRTRAEAGEIVRPFRRIYQQVFVVRTA